MKKHLFLVFLGLALICPNPLWADEADKSSDIRGSLVTAIKDQVDLHLSSIAVEMDILAQSDQVRSGDWSAMKPIMTSYQDARPNLAVFFFRPNGSYYNPKAGLTGKNVSEREYFPKLMGGEKIFFYLVVSRSTGRKSAFSASPVFRDGKVIGAVGASTFLTDISTRLSESLSLPDNMFYYALAPDGRTTLHSKSVRIFLDPRKHNSPGLAAGAEKILACEKGEVEYEFEGAPRLVIFEKSPVTGWTYALGTINP